jgi:hypothetical protein
MKNTYVLMIVQALLTLLLFFSEGYVRYATIALFLLMDLILFASLLTKRWSYEELLTFAALFCSGVFILFYLFMKSSITIIFGVALMLLFMVIAMLDFMSQPVSLKRAPDKDKFENVSLPEAPAHYYDVEYDAGYDVYPEESQIKSSQTIQSQKQPQKKVQPIPQYKTMSAVPEPVMHVKHGKASSDVEGKLAARAVAHELEREATQLKNAEKMMKDLEIYNTEKELLRETKAMEDAEKRMNLLQTKNAEKELLRETKTLEDAQKRMDLMTAKNRTVNAKVKATQKNIQVAQELKKEAAEIMKVQKQINAIQNIQKAKEIQKEAKTLKNAEKQIKEVQFLNQQEKMVSQAKAIAKAQKDIDTLKNKKPIKQPVKVKTVKTKDESFYFSTENGNKFHEPGCMAIKNVPKNKLTLFTSKKDAMKKGLQPCSVCIPK